MPERSFPACTTRLATAGFFVCTVVAGIGMGAGLQGGFRTVIPLAPPRERAGVPSVLYVVCYCGMGVPAVVAGILVVDAGGLIGSARDYALFMIVLAVAALAGLLLTNPERSATGLCHRSVPLGIIRRLDVQSGGQSVPDLVDVNKLGR